MPVLQPSLTGATAGRGSQTLPMEQRSPTHVGYTQTQGGPSTSSGSPPCAVWLTAEAEASGVGLLPAATHLLPLVSASQGPSLPGPEPPLQLSAWGELLQEARPSLRPQRTVPCDPRLPSGWGLSGDRGFEVQDLERCLCWTPIHRRALKL